ncbi:FecR family protein [Phocaeicola sp.]
MENEKNNRQANSRSNKMETTDTNDHRLESLFGEALGDTATRDETQAAWQAFTRRRRAAGRRLIYGSVAAIAAAVTFILVLWPLHTGESLQEVEVFTSIETSQEITFSEAGERMIVTTPPATTTTLQLSDGTKVLLSANSRLEYLKDFSDTLRSVSLVGEARFEVAKDAARPFIVNTEQVQTRVLGTTFYIKAYRNYRPNITLYEGRVHVNSTDLKQNQNMNPGEQVSMDKSGKLLLTKVDTGKQMDLSENVFSFDNSDLMQAMQEIGNWYNISVVFRSRPLLDERIYFHINRQLPVHAVLDALNDLNIAHFSVKDNKIVVSAHP